MLFANLQVFAQNNEDFGIWMGSDFSKKINKKFDLLGSLSLRTEDNSTHVRQVFYQIGAKYELVDDLKTAISYRNALKFNYGPADLTHRFIWDLSYKLKLNSFAFQLRNRLQYSLKDEDSNDWVDRIRLKAEIDLQDGLDGFIFNEVFFKLTDSYKDRLERNRFGFGMSYKINKDFSVSLAYFRQNSLGYQTPETFNAISLEFEIDL